MTATSCQEKPPAVGGGTKDSGGDVLMTLMGGLGPPVGTAPKQAVVSPPLGPRLMALGPGPGGIAPKQAVVSPPHGPLMVLAGPGPGGTAPKHDEAPPPPYGPAAAMSHCCGVAAWQHAAAGHIEVCILGSTRSGRHGGG